uniref:Syntaxin 7-like n=1 Tax=Eptatretus burgeri TaxID=7764 RepID=A0A8C4QH92_EPTBU
RLKELSSLPAAQSEQRKLQRDRLASEFSTALNNFQAMQRKAAEKEKESVARARANSRLLQPVRDFSPVLLQDETVGVTAQDLEELKEREGAIMQLEADIVDVNQIFKDLGTMIHEQGDIIDSIEANVETAETSVQQANRELRAASRHQSASRKKICLLLLVLAVAALVLGIVIWLSTRK